MKQSANAVTAKRTTFIEQEYERELLAHQSRLKNIKSQFNMRENINQYNYLQEKTNSQSLKNKRFAEQEKQREYQLANKALIKQLMNIQMGKNTYFQQINITPLEIKKAHTSSGKRQAKSSIRERESPEKNDNDITALDDQKFQKKKLNKSYFSGGLHSAAKKQEEQRIQLDNLALAHRMIRLPPVINKSKLDKEYRQHRLLVAGLQKYTRQGVKSGRSGSKNQIRNLSPIINQIQNNQQTGEDNQVLMNQKVQLVITLIDISFINFLPMNCDSELYFLEIKSSIKQPRFTNPEMYINFSKSVINETITYKELCQNKLVYIALWQKVEKQEKFLGDFELDMTPYYLSTAEHHIHYDLRNYKDFRNLPNHVPKDMRKKGWIDFLLYVKSDLQLFLQDKITEEGNSTNSQLLQQPGDSIANDNSQVANKINIINEQQLNPDLILNQNNHQDQKPNPNNLNNIQNQKNNEINEPQDQQKIQIIKNQQ